MIFGLRRDGGNNAKPEARAISITAVVPSPITPHRAWIGSFKGPVTVLVKNSPLVLPTRASSVPSPPSATGSWTVSAPGKTAFTPSLMAFAASTPGSPPLKVWGEITTFMMGLIIHSWWCPLWGNYPQQRKHTFERECPFGVNFVTICANAQGGDTCPQERISRPRFTQKSTPGPRRLSESPRPSWNTQSPGSERSRLPA